MLPALPSSTICVSSAVSPTQSVLLFVTMPCTQPADLQPSANQPPVPDVLLLLPLYVKHTPALFAAIASSANGPTTPIAISDAAPRIDSLSTFSNPPADATTLDARPPRATACSDAATHVRVCSHQIDLKILFISYPSRY
ncbi:hypothetical protein X961_4406 [Burkholderia pseudomallei MSHR5613]|nr:hypothetical protein DO70_5242 [Burkholderia pseudomallei]KGS23152.1 hypothetical protein X989_2801 [Burkholderia pseudomallei MSHR4378]KGS46547.1 hypothetical protein X961_4406 [Burkholderia pseudomallei MSHR5613]KGS92834.1 hypothetical protein X963_4923 [Burkholderia pseudomallei MSHR7498]KGW37832.1 hypothetical protein Y047_5795 [Burkholderia pseudomallei MSHR3016]KGW92545.1 hypothetical protein Y048_4638 [Burkholderia pseudomallei MSHR456]KGX78401.1 hypothetical protein Y033_4662 [Burk